jgi:hypothetical protein
MASWVRTLGVAGLVVLSLTACAADEAASSTSARKPEPARQDYVPGEYILSARSGVDAATITASYAAFGVENVQGLGGGRFLLRLARDPGIERVRTLGVESGQIDAVQRNFIYRKRNASIPRGN